MQVSRRVSSQVAIGRKASLEKVFLNEAQMDVAGTSQLRAPNSAGTPRETSDVLAENELLRKRIVELEQLVISSPRSVDLDQVAPSNGRTGSRLRDSIDEEPETSVRREGSASRVKVPVLARNPSFVGRSVSPNAQLDMISPRSRNGSSPNGGPVPGNSGPVVPQIKLSTTVRSQLTRVPSTTVTRVNSHAAVRPAAPQPSPSQAPSLVRTRTVPHNSTPTTDSPRSTTSDRALKSRTLPRPITNPLAKKPIERQNSGPARKPRSPAQSPLKPSLAVGHGYRHDEDEDDDSENESNVGVQHDRSPGVVSRSMQGSRVGVDPSESIDSLAPKLTLNLAKMPNPSTPQRARPPQPLGSSHTTTDRPITVSPSKSGTPRTLIRTMSPRSARPAESPRGLMSPRTIHGAKDGTVGVLRKVGSSSKVRPTPPATLRPPNDGPDRAAMFATRKVSRDAMPAQVARTDSATRVKMQRLKPAVPKVKPVKDERPSRRPSLTAPSKQELRKIRELNQLANKERKDQLKHWKLEQEAKRRADELKRKVERKYDEERKREERDRHNSPVIRRLGSPIRSKSNLKTSEVDQPDSPLQSPASGASHNVPTTSHAAILIQPETPPQREEEVKVPPLPEVAPTPPPPAPVAAAPHSSPVMSSPVTVTAPAASIHPAKERFPKLSFDDLEDFGMLGRGCFGKVKLVRHKGNGKMYALKVLNKRHQISQQQVQHAINENTILQMMDHPFIVTHHGSFQDEKNLYILMERVVGTEFYDLLQEVAHFTEEQTKFFAAQIVLILEHLHVRHKVLYRDLKPENILLDSDGYLKLTDFGFAKVEPNRTYTFCGTPCYIAPEIIYQTGYSRAVDWWSLGVMIYEMLKGEPPLDNDDLLQLYDDILNTHPTFDETFSDEAKDIITRLLNKNPERRFGASGRGAGDVKRHPFFRGIDWGAIERREFKSPFGGIAYLQCGLEPYDEGEDEEPPEDDEPLNSQEQTLFKNF